MASDCLRSGKLPCMLVSLTAAGCFLPHANGSHVSCNQSDSHVAANDLRSSNQRVICWALAPAQALGEAQWIKCDIRSFDMTVLGKFGVIMADPPWRARCSALLPGCSRAHATYHLVLQPGLSASFREQPLAACAGGHPKSIAVLGPCWRHQIQGCVANHAWVRLRGERCSSCPLT